MTPSNYITIPIQRGLFEIESLINLVNKYGGYIMGGYVRYMCSIRSTPIHAHDIDIFTNSFENYNNFVREFEALGLNKQFDNDVSTTYIRPESGPFFNCPKIQLIKPKIEGAIITTGTIEDILNNFDFSITRIALTPNSDGKTAIADENFLEDEKNGHIKILNIHCPISSMLRVVKYGRKGYQIRSAEAIKLFADWSNRETEYRNNIEERLQTAQEGTLTQEELNELYKLMSID